MCVPLLWSRLINATQLVLDFPQGSGLDREECYLWNYCYQHLMKAVINERLDNMSLTCTNAYKWTLACILSISMIRSVMFTWQYCMHTWSAHTIKKADLWTGYLSIHHNATFLLNLCHEYCVYISQNIVICGARWLLCKIKLFPFQPRNIPVHCTVSTILRKEHPHLFLDVVAFL